MNDLRVKSDHHHHTTKERERAPLRKRLLSSLTSIPKDSVTQGENARKSRCLRPHEPSCSGDCCISLSLTLDSSLFKCLHLFQSPGHSSFGRRLHLVRNRSQILKSIQFTYRPKVKVTQNEFRTMNDQQKSAKLMRNTFVFRRSVRRFAAIIAFQQRMK